MSLPIAAALLLLFSACSDGVSPDPSLPYRASEWLWPATITDCTYGVERDGQFYRHVLTRETNGGFHDVLHDAQDRVLARTFWNVSPTSGLLSGIEVNTLWHLPVTHRLAEIVGSIPGPEVRGSILLPLDAGALLAGSDQGGIFHYSAASGEWYAMELPVQDGITALARDSVTGNTTLFFAAGSAGIYSKGRHDAVWTRLPAPAGRVSDIESSQSDVLFAVIDRQLWFSRRPFLSWISFSTFPGGESINDIAILPLHAEQEVLFVATESLGIAYIQLNKSLPAQIGYSERSEFERVRRISTCAASPYPAVGLSDPAQLFVAPFPGVWVGIPLDPSLVTTAVAQAPARGTVLIGSTTGVYRYTGAMPVPSGLHDRHVLALRSAPDGAFYAGTDRGVYRSRDDGLTWTRIDGGTVITRYPAPWMLLPPRFAIGSAWPAVELLGGSGASMTVTGRVLQHFDELILPRDRGRFEDAMLVRFAMEGGNGAPSGSGPVWHAWFVRGRGIVYIEESTGSVVSSRTFLE
ncbi:MAG: hypothetical protein KFF77_05395 [Bacteroidetes bacterium]|nr:hypothetical protein [Bacteroidota bacterium]